MSFGLTGIGLLAMHGAAIAWTCLPLSRRGDFLLLGDGVFFLGDGDLDFFLGLGEGVFFLGDCDLLGLVLGVALCFRFLGSK